MKSDKKIYKYITDILAGLALLWVCVGFYSYDFYSKYFDPRLVLGFNYIHEGVVLSLSGLGILTGIVFIKRAKKWPPSFFINFIVFIILFLVSTGYDLYVFFMRLKGGQ